MQSVSSCRRKRRIANPSYVVQPTGVVSGRSTDSTDACPRSSSSTRAVSTAGAYVDQLVLNVFDGPGTIDVWIDDLDVGPVLGEPKPEGVVAVPAVRPTPGALVPRGPSEVRFAGKRLMIDNKPFMMRAIRHTGLPLSVLNMAGFNTLWLDESAPNERIAAAFSNAIARSISRARPAPRARSTRCNTREGSPCIGPDPSWKISDNNVAFAPSSSSS